MRQVDTIIYPRWVVPVVPRNLVHEDHAVVIHQGRIVDLLPADRAREEYAAAREISRPRHILIPGLVNTHTHAAMTLMRGLADDLQLMDWLKGHIWPAEGEWVSPDFVRDGTQLAVAEMLLSGTTCANDMYFFPDVVAQTTAELGMRFCVGIIVLDGPSAWGQGAAEYLAKGLEIRDAYKGHPLVKAVFAPHAPYSVSDEPLLRIRRLADELDVPVHMHVHESSDEIEQSIERFGKRPLERLDDLGLLSPELLAVHMTQLTPEEIESVASSRAHVVHCPESNLKLASGFCPVAELLGAGVNVALGTDGSASNNDLCMLGEMRSASLLAKGVAGKADVVTAFQSLEMATINGARALGLDEEIGSISVGKWADIACLEMTSPCAWPVYNPVSQVVYALGRDAMSDVWVAGRQLVDTGELTQVEKEELYRKAETWRQRLAPFSHTTMTPATESDNEASGE